MRTLAVFGIGVALAGSAWAAAPRPQSPAGLDAGAFASCPAFHWAAGDAVGIELVVYDQDGEPVLFRQLPGSARFWTPSLDRCLEAPGLYAWAVRSVDKNGAGEWSEPSVFRVESEATHAASLDPRLALVEVSSEPEVVVDPVPGGPAGHEPVPVTNDAKGAESLVQQSFGPGGAEFAVKGGAAIEGALAVGADESQAPLHVRTLDTEIPDAFLNGEELLIEGNDAVLGLYSTQAGPSGSAIVFGETLDNVAVTGGKWGIVRETSTEGSDLRFTYGIQADPFANDTKFEIQDDGILHGRGIPVAWGVVVVEDGAPTIEAGSGNFTVQLFSVMGDNFFQISSSDIDCTQDPAILATPRRESQPFAYRSAQATCDMLAEIRVFDSLGSTFLEGVFFVVFDG